MLKNADRSIRRDKKTDTLTIKEREFKKINRKVRQLARDVSSIISKHNAYSINGVVNKVTWFERYPIETLFDSLNKDRGIRTSNFSIQDLEEKGKLRRLHYEKIDELAIAQHKRNEAEIDVMLEKVKRLLR